MTGDLLKQGIAALNAGRKEEARRLLMQFVQQDERNEMGWLWLSGAVDTDEDRRVCLENVLAINPNNGVARRGLESLIAKKGVRSLGVASSPLPEAKPLKGKSPEQSVAGTREDIKPQTNHQGYKPVPRARTQKSKTRPRWGWLFLGGGTVLALLLGCLLTYTMGFIRLPSRVFATPTPLPTPTLTPEQMYTHAMEPALRQLNTWLYGPVANWDKLMASGMSDGEGYYGFVLDLCLIAPSMYEGSNVWKELQNTAIPAAIAIAEGGFEVKSSLGAATPPPSISVAHEQIVACVEYKIGLANAIADFLSRSIIPNIESEPDPCNLLPSAINQVTTFVQNNR